MADDDIPTLEQADRKGALRPTEEEFNEFLRRFPDIETFDQPMTENCARPRKLCWKTNCITDPLTGKRQRATMYLDELGRCNERRIENC